MKTPWAAVALCVATTSGCHSLTEMPRDEAAALLSALRDGYRKKDLAAYRERLSEDFRGGREAFLSALREEFERYAEIPRTKAHLLSMREVAGGWEARALFRVWGVTGDGTRRYEDRVLRLGFALDGRGELRATRIEPVEQRVVEGPGDGFRERAAEVGLAIRHTPHTPYDEANKKLVPGLYSGAGASAGDVDGDGWPDLLVGDGRQVRFLRNVSGNFVDATAAAGLEGVGKVRGAYLVDVDDDGRLDAFFTTVKQRPRLFLNRGRLRFEEVPGWLEEVPEGNYESACFADLDGDGDLDVYLCRYGIFEKVSFAYPLYNATDGEPDVLLRNDGDRLRPVDAAPARVKAWTLAVCAGDYDGDGDPDLYQVDDFGVNHLWRNDGGWNFTDVSEEAGVTDQGFGMGSCFGDYDGDGDLDILVANVHSSARWIFDDPDFPLPLVADLFLRDYVRDEVDKVLRGNSLLQNQGDGTFVQKAGAAGIERSEWAWGATFFDYDNDGDLDIYCPNGYITGTDPGDT
ncbi:MAG: VCBS repeat-containing protein [Planctomycetota bacterium]|nr:MAG: VCBS repeat-containing protein [Planctomycetota bacterium]